jgi:cytochrome oxidase Cu insertion factor (SCO1/SenC/PrrC family)
MARRASIAHFSLGAFALLAAACGSDAGAPATSSPGGSNGTQLAAAPSNAKVGREVGELAPDFEVKDVDGKPFKLSDYRGKVVLIDFWGFW